MIHYKRRGTYGHNSFEALGTVNAIAIPGYEDVPAVSLCRDAVLAIDDHWSVFKEGSEIAKMNACAGKGQVSVSRDTMKILQRARYFSELSQGTFDSTVRPLTALWRVGEALEAPEKANIKRVKRLVNYEDLLLDEQNCRAGLRKKGQGLDLGGIAKGFAADEAKEILLENGLENALIDFGGTIITMGHPSVGRNWTVGIQNPVAPPGNSIGFLDTKNEAIVTSGSYARHFTKNGRVYHHIIDPRTGVPAESGLFSVTVIGDSAMDMDALATAVFILGMEKSLGILTELQAQAIFITKEMAVFVTPGLAARFHLKGNSVTGVRYA